jgi:UDP-N-acetylmuramyl pentapeptide phosphotransferase/UDP-N-acetylglucosamine-1-phosphate transferase
MPDMADAWTTVGNLAPAVWLASLVICGVLILVLSPLLGNVAIAVPTQRSSHARPTPQWGGLAICAATIGMTGVVVLGSGIFDAATQNQTVMVLLAAALLVVLGVADDTLHLGPLVKIAVQAVAVGIVLFALPDAMRVLPALPLSLERALLFAGAVWFVNLVNFMDGIDWMMVAEVVPVTVGVAIIGVLGPLPPVALILALALNGAMLGFAPFNRPLARLFMGDTGSLPIGLLLAYLLICIAAAGHLTAALLLPLYFLADTGVTVLRRALAGERVWEAHRSHFYQRARDNGFSDMQVVRRVFAVNVALVGLAALSVIATLPLSQLLALTAGVCLVAWLMLVFSTRRS